MYHYVRKYIEPLRSIIVLSSTFLLGSLRRISLLQLSRILYLKYTLSPWMQNYWKGTTGVPKLYQLTKELWRSLFRSYATNGCWYRRIHCFVMYWLAARSYLIHLSYCWFVESTVADRADSSRGDNGWHGDGTEDHKRRKNCSRECVQEPSTESEGHGFYA